MKIIPKFFHGILDYMMGLCLVLAPNLFGFTDAGAAAVWIPRIVGLLILGQAMTTDYELGIMKLIPIAMHLMADYVVGAFLLFAPFLLGVHNRSQTAMTITAIA